MADATSGPWPFELLPLAESRRLTPSQRAVVGFPALKAAEELLRAGNRLRAAEKGGT